MPNFVTATFVIAQELDASLVPEPSSAARAGAMLRQIVSIATTPPGVSTSVRSSLAGGFNRKPPLDSSWKSGPAA